MSLREEALAEARHAMLAYARGDKLSTYEACCSLRTAFNEIHRLEQKLAEQQLDDIRRFGT